MLAFHAMLQAQVKKCKVTSTTTPNGNFTDSGLYPMVTISYLDRPSVTADYFSPYGLYGSPPVDAEGYCFNIGGSEANRFAMVNWMQQRFKTAAPGEVIVGNPVTGSKAYFKADGSIDVEAKGGLVINVTGDAEINSSGKTTVNAGTEIDLIAATEINLTAPQINLNGDVGANNGDISMNNGVFTASQDVIADGISLKSHIHANVTNGPDETDPASMP